MDMTNVLHQMTLLFLLMLVGFLCRKAGAIEENADAVFASFVVNITLPASIIGASTSSNIYFDGTTVLLYASVSGMIYVLALGVGRVFTKVFCVAPKDAGLYRFMLAFSNTGFIGYPIMGAVLGTESFVLVSIFHLPFNIFVYSLGIYIISERMNSFRVRNLLTPCLAASVSSIMLGLFRVELPTIITDFCGMLGAATTPCAMIVVGSILATVAVKDIFSQWKLYVLIMIKLLAFPFLLLFVLKKLIDDQMLLQIAVITAALPCATNTALLCTQYGGNEKLASEGIFVSTLLSFFTIPAVLSFLPAN